MCTDGCGEHGMSKLYFDYWGKAGETGDFHLLVYHSLDVAACGTVLLERHAPLRRLLSIRLGLAQTSLSSWLTFMLALHDVGKFSYRFQRLRCDWPHDPNDPAADAPYHPRHDTLGAVAWLGLLERPVIERFVAEPMRSRQGKTALRYWIASATGHHGQPPKPKAQGIEGLFTQVDQHAAQCFCMDVGALLLDGGLLEVADVQSFAKAMKPISWWLAGVAVLCDWLGSNRERFSFCPNAMPLADYWTQHALPAAEEAIASSGVLPIPSSRCDHHALFDFEQPTPLQRLAADVDLRDSPQLLILEDVTGSGKTEAALTAAHRIMGRGGADGLYFGLPTMATSNAMHSRIAGKGLARSLFTEAPALVLTHGAARLQRDVPVRAQILPADAAEADYTDTEASAANLRASWINDHRKKALLADLGVGTIDQALLAVLPSRHQSLRLLGLARKVLIVDEVHAYDAYMQQLLQGLLRFQAYIGGHVILLSATLPHDIRQTLADAFRDGLAVAPAELRSTDYPLMTLVDAERADEHPIATRPEVARRVRVELIGDAEAVLDLLLEAHRDGRCACWIRNSVDDAIEAVETLKAAGVPAECLELFHARFVLGDRLDIEQRVLANFGPESTPAERAGRILIATQVVEQSLDLDFDAMVTDLAPVDLVIQRAGRLHRHDRGPRPTPCLHVLTPEPIDTASADWLASLLPRTSKVYEDLACLWRTARLLREHGCIRMPEAARELIEGVYGKEALATPADVESASVRAQGEELNARSIGKYNTLRLERGYADPDAEYWDDIKAPTRLGEDSLRLRLARWDGERLRPWRGDGAGEMRDWAMSEVSVHANWCASAQEPRDEALCRALMNYEQTVPDKGRWSLLLPMHQSDSDAWEAEVMDRAGKPTLLRYLVGRGLVRAQKA